MHHVFRVNRRVLPILTAALVAVSAGAVLAMGASAQRSHSAPRHHRGGSESLRGSGGLRITSEPWGTVDGQPVALFTLSNGHRMTVKITNYGGVVQSIWVPDRFGRVKNVALG